MNDKVQGLIYRWQRWRLIYRWASRIICSVSQSRNKVDNHHLLMGAGGWEFGHRWKGIDLILLFIGVVRRRRRQWLCWQQWYWPGRSIICHCCQQLQGNLLHIPLYWYSISGNDRAGGSYMCDAHHNDWLLDREFCSYVPVGYIVRVTIVHWPWCQQRKLGSSHSLTDGLVRCLWSLGWVCVWPGHACSYEKAWDTDPCG